MIVVMSTTATARDISEVIARIRSIGYEVHLSEGKERTIIGVIGRGRPLDREQLGLLPGVQDVVPVSHPYKIASREYHPDDTLIPLNGIEVGGPNLAIIAGPCAVESREQIIETAYAVKEAGATALRGGAFKPRTSPYSFQGLGEEGLRYLAEAREQTGLPVVTEVMEPATVQVCCDYADVLQIGARNMQNYALLHAVGESQHPVLLKRGMSSTIEELLMAAEYILSHGNMRVMLCERGIRTFETATRNTFDLNAIPVLKQASHLPVIADPSHALGKWEYVESVSMGAIAAGADGLILEVHMDPDHAESDGRQSLKPERFAALVSKITQLAPIVGRKVTTHSPAAQHG
ncbi:MAG TPA: 3-deoxy-7-phosphoheptulonate synthase [Aggregatilinea sp.]|jgi:3-deoxy-7-phosphoheptulonate synthase|uniref:3-deoxy-7-phosphoheptulonate synthase n=1 Tax=Aggregatilinea sp. TaxID=2806333 RepID=UPI002CEB7463|nr:3-deoxy-7-phosphoheptulonate synthase [Aggregatilinea sp.]HML23567.1 3-deoxy-7-phosphoheptulonate synthase [Aggregatilinea sp.]